VDFIGEDKADHGVAEIVRGLIDQGLALRRDVSAAGVRRSPIVTPDVVVGKGDEEVNALHG